MITRHRGKVHLTMKQLKVYLGIPEHLEVLGCEQDSMKGGIRITVDGEGMPAHHGHSAFQEITLEDCRSIKQEVTA